MTEQHGTATGDEEEESFQLNDLVTSILEECKATPLPSTLDTAIHPFREALDKRSMPHHMRSHSLRDHAGAPVTRFRLTNQCQDLDQAIHMWDEVLKGIGGRFQLSIRVWSVFRF